jgi:hypothetical protein
VQALARAQKNNSGIQWLSRKKLLTALVISVECRLTAGT